MEHTEQVTPDISEDWDYEIPHKCQYEVEAKGTPEGVGGCNEPACYRVWWNEYAMGDIHEVGIMWVCQEHFNFMRQCEQKADNTIEVDDPAPTDEDLRVEAMISLFVTMKARIQDFQYIRLLSYPHICKKDVIKILDDHQKQMEDIIRWEIVK